MSTADSSSFGAIEGIIGSATSVYEIIAALAQRGCGDLTSSIDLTTCTEFPCAGGGYCDIYRGRLSDGTTVAIKSLRVYDEPGKDTQRKKILKHAARELYHWSKLQHFNVLPLLGLSLFQGRISMISEWMDNGNLMSFLEHHPETDRTPLCVEICEGLCYIHAKGMVHGDLKAANIMVSPRGIPVIADFGCARLKDLTLKFTNTTANSFSVRWAAPELLRQDDGSMAADVYAYGMTALEVLSGKIPFAGVPEHRVICLVLVERRHPPRPDTIIDDKLWEILLSCWAPTPEQRPSSLNVSDRLHALDEPSDTSSDLRALKMSAHHMFTSLVEHGCVDLTAELDTSTYSEHPISSDDFMDVYRGMLHDGSPVVIKCWRLNGGLANASSPRLIKRSMREIYHWSKCRHRNVLSLLGVTLYRNQPAMVTLQAGSLKGVLLAQPQIDRWALCAQIAKGVSYLHECYMVCGNIRGENIVLSDDFTPLLDIVNPSIIRDLILDSLDTGGELSKLLRWTPPEVLEEGGSRFTFSADVYSLGMTILEVITGSLPYGGMNDIVVTVKITKGIHPARPGEYIRPGDPQADALWLLLSHCWAYDPGDRPTAHQVSDMMRTITLDRLSVTSNRST